MIGFSEPINEVLKRLGSSLPAGVNLYLVGGSLRDMLLGWETHDLDFILTGDVLSQARRWANQLGAAYFPLDEERQTARLLLPMPDGQRLTLDFSALRGDDLHSDLRLRDFTINAMALPVASPVANSPQLIDPLGGAADLHARLLRACSETSLRDDPLRVMRSVRLAVFLKCKIHPDTGRQIRQAAALLEHVSPERVRDELFRMLDGPEPATAVRLMEILGILPNVLPELTTLKGVAQPAELNNLPLSKTDVWTHTLESVKRLGLVFQVLSMSYEQEKAASWALGFITVQLGRYRQQLADHLATRLNPERSLRSLIFLAGLYHDVGKPNTQQVDPSGRMRFFGHEQVGARLVAKRARLLRLSNDEIERLAILVENHMRPLLLAQSGEAPSRRAIYRYFRTTGGAGIDLGLFSLADSMATYGPALPRETWAQHLNVVRALCEAWWEQPDQIITPPMLVDGNDLMGIFNLQPGPLIGDLLEAVRESQAAGQVNTRQQALDLVDNRLKGIG